MSRSMIAATAALVALAGTAARAEPFAMVPMAAFVQDIGGKQVVGYHLASDGACAVTLVVSEPVTKEATTTAAARVRFSLAARSSATVASAGGGELALTCGEDARTLVIDTLPAARQLAGR